MSRTQTDTPPPAEAGAAEDEARTNQATELLAVLTSESPRFYRSPSGSAFVQVRDRYYACPSPDLAHVLRAMWLEAKQFVPANDLTKPVMAMVESLILHDPDTEEREVFVRIGFDEADGAIYYDLSERGNQRAVKVSAQGVSIVDDPPVIFLRPAGQLAAPEPMLDPEECSKALKAFQKLTRLDAPSFTLLMVWLLSCLSPARERMLLNIFSEAGSGKTELAQAMRQLIDPSSHTESNKFENARDLCAAAANQGVLYMGNLSGLEQWLSNVLCLLLTQGTFQTRSLYTNGGLFSLNLLLPVILTSLSNPIWAADLGSRTIPVESPPIDPSDRIGTNELHRRFAALQPGVLGALCLRRRRPWPTRSRVCWSTVCKPPSTSWPVASTGSG